jgi:hypothetical protein
VAGPTGPVAHTGALASPACWLAVVVAAIYLNQVLFTVYVLRVHDGDVSFVAQYLPTGWFALAGDHPLMVAVAQAAPRPELLAPSVLRVPALLELPFVVLAYLVVCRWWGGRLYQTLAGPAVLMSACGAYTVTFCLIEWSFRNPYTWHDIALRVLAGALTVVGVTRIASRTRARDVAVGGPRSAPDSVVFVLSAGALGYLVLVVYDTALLYNLGHLDGHAPGVAVALTVLGAARLAANRRRRTSRRPGLTVETVVAGLGWFAALLFVPALPLRYAIGFTAPLCAAGAAVIIAATAAVLALRCGCRRMPSPWNNRAVAGWLSLCAATALAGVAAALAGDLTVLSGYPESRVLLASGLFLAIVIPIAALLDRLIPLCRAKGTLVPWRSCRSEFDPSE